MSLIRGSGRQLGEASSFPAPRGFLGIALGDWLAGSPRRPGQGSSCPSPAPSHTDTKLQTQLPPHNDKEAHKSSPATAPILTFDLTFILGDDLFVLLESARGGHSPVLPGWLSVGKFSPVVRQAANGIPRVPEPEAAPAAGKGEDEEEEEAAERRRKEKEAPRSEPRTRLTRALAPCSRAGAALGDPQGCRGWRPERPGARSNSSERVAGGVALPTRAGARPLPLGALGGRGVRAGAPHHC